MFFQQANCVERKAGVRARDFATVGRVGGRVYGLAGPKTRFWRTLKTAIADGGFSPIG